MQYDIGDAPLEKPKEEPKKSLDPHEEKKLSGDMRELYDRLLPSEESDKRRLKFVEKLERILRQQWPDTEFTVHIFGSSGNLLCTSESDGMIREPAGRTGKVLTGFSGYLHTNTDEEAGDHAHVGRGFGKQYVPA